MMTQIKMTNNWGFHRMEENYLKILVKKICYWMESTLCNLLKIFLNN